MLRTPLLSLVLVVLGFAQPAQAGDALVWVEPTSDYTFDGTVATFTVGVYVEESGPDVSTSVLFIYYMIEHDENTEAVAVTGNSDLVTDPVSFIQLSAPSLECHPTRNYWMGYAAASPGCFVPPEPFFFDPWDDPTLIAEFVVEWTPSGPWQNGDPIEAPIFVGDNLTDPFVYYQYDDYPNSCDAPVFGLLPDILACLGDHPDYIPDPAQSITVMPDTSDPCSLEPCFLRGDADGDGIFNGLADGLFSLEHQFLGGPAPPCLEAADADSDGVFNGLADGLFTLEHQFLGGPAPGAPFPACGLDPDSPASLGCDVGSCP